MVLPTEEVVRRLEAARQEHRDGILAFDADGTLWDGDVGVDLFEAALRERVLRREASEALSREATRAGLPVTEDPNDQAALLYSAFVAHGLDERVMFEIMAWGFAGFDAREMDDFARHVLAGNGLAARITAELEPVLSWARAHDVEMLIVSASPRAIVERSVVVRGLPPTSVIAMTPLVAGSVIAPGVVEPAPYAGGKALAIDAASRGRVLLGAFGDSAFDAEMLRKARVPVMIRPKPSLLARAQEITGAVELARAASQAIGSSSGRLTF